MNPTLKTDYMRKERFDSIRSKFHNISAEAEKKLHEVNAADILAVDLSFGDYVEVIDINVITEDELVKAMFN